MGVLLASIEALIAGYVAAVLVQLLLMLIITRLGRSVLVTGDRLNGLYQAFRGASWIASSAVGCSVAFSVAGVIYPPYSSWVFCFSVAILLIVAVCRVHTDARHQHALSANSTVVVCILVGAALGGFFSTPL